MDSLDHIKAEALEQWASGRVLRAWLGVEELFPYTIDLNSEACAAPSPASVNLTAWIHPVEAESRCHSGRGYRIEFSADGDRRRPQRVLFDQPIDLIQYIGKDQEFSRFVRLVLEIRRRLPGLKHWIEAHPMRVLEVGDRWHALLDQLESHLRVSEMQDQDEEDNGLLAELHHYITGSGRETS